jgi:hypothetical protein
MKLPLRGVFYASKTSARLSVELGVHGETLASQLKAVTCPYEVVLNYLHYVYYKKEALPKLDVL